MAQLGSIARGSDNKVRDGTQKSHIKHPVMGSAIFTYKSRAVYAEHYGEVLQGYIVNELVVSALQKSGVNHAIRNKPSCSPTCCKGYGVLFGNTYIKHSMRKRLVHSGKSATTAHCRGNGYNFGVECSKLGEGLPYYLLVFCRK